VEYRALTLAGLSVMSRPALVPIQWAQELLFRGLKRQGRVVDHPPPSSAEVKNAGAVLLLPHTSSWRGA
jgi:hypothetical protein